MRVLAVAHLLHLLALQRQAAGEERGLALGIEAGEVVRDGRVVRGGVRERLLREREPRRGAERAAVRLHLGEDPVVVRRIGHHRDARVVLRRGAHHRRPADVDVLDRLVERAAGPRDRLAERVEVDDDEVDRLDAGLLDRRHVLRQVAPREQAAVDLRVQRLHAARRASRGSRCSRRPR